MNNPKHAVEKIKSLMKEYGFLAEEKPEYASFSLNDENNTILQVEKLEVGNKILKINEQFEQVSLEDGNYKLKENFEISVENGEIVAVKEIFVEAKLIDGTKVKVEGEGLEIGAKVHVVTEEGEIPAPDGTHELEDGTKVSTEKGLITNVIEAVKEEEDGGMEGDTAQNKEIELKEGDTAKNKEYEMEIYDMLANIMKKMEEKMGDMKEKMEKMESDFNAFKKEPAAQPVKVNKAEFSSEENNSEDARIKAIMALKRK